MYICMFWSSIDCGIDSQLSILGSYILQTELFRCVPMRKQYQKQQWLSVVLLGSTYTLLCMWCCPMQSWDRRSDWWGILSPVPMPTRT